MQVSEIMTTQVTTVAPDSSAKSAGQVMAARGFAALPVVDGNHAVMGIVAEADVLRDRLAQDPRLHLRRDAGDGPIPPLLVRGVMTTAVRTVLATADVAELANLFLDEGLRSVPVLDDGRLVGIVSRRDVLRALGRPDDEIGRDVLRLVDSYTGRPGAWSVAVSEGVASLSRPVAVLPEPPAEDAAVAQRDAAVDVEAVRTLARTVPGVVAVRC
ncbi:CBS domain-containing protein [Blastococcus sp. CT_GayMR19]|uniref:CBS domain-containing protein n=1 Tax=Blastococcus sp. CT_GayMR19 TaxID=2559608 RepID=UPI0010732EF0|nr:CBS domain-containing protein [Blastococcus sp. CT_GayMR19]TFV79516.1 CBS domain-containing protein [Blastococcus sp. CT_GayMR19]